jgi:hypothetical protein
VPTHAWVGIGTLGGTTGEGSNAESPVITTTDTEAVAYALQPLALQARTW